MCTLCEQYDNKILNSKDVFEQISLEMRDSKTFDAKKARHFEVLTERILDKEMPFEDTFTEDVVQYSGEDE